MRSKVAVVLSLIFILATGTAALVVNTRILDTSPQNDIGRANEVLVPAPSAPGVTTGVPPSVLPPPPQPPTSRGDDEDRSPAQRHDHGADDESDD